MPGSSLPRKLDVSEIVKRNRSFAHSTDLIKDQQLLEAIEALSQQVDRYLFLNSLPFLFICFSFFFFFLNMHFVQLLFNSISINKKILQPRSYNN